MVLFSEEADTCADCLAQEYTIEHGLIRDAGKFEGEPLAAYHAYHFMLNGFQDEDIDGVVRVGNVLIEESESGFVYSSVYDTEEEAIARMAEIEVEEENEEEEESN